MKIRGYPYFNAAFFLIIYPSMGFFAGKFNPMEDDEKQDRWMNDRAREGGCDF